ncbi:MAG: putative DNA-binding domain-containing protein [Pseudomonadota bacterium]|nr:DUF2063 domain-containing protein [Pseudomonadales bacterium]MDY6921755.1 putative DNA-binding domain-containing protein [Pseudomonadota bacterium]
MAQSEAFQRLQYQLAGHLRDPERNPAPSGIEERRLQVYRDLLYNNVESFIRNGFPVLRSISSDQHWHQMVRDFFASYRCRTPYFLEISAEFLAYLQQQREPGATDYPFLLELAHYEWIELAVDTAPEMNPRTGFNPRGDLMRGQPLISPLAQVLSYRFPVHRIGPQFLPDQVPEQATFLIVNRDPEDQVRFMEINAVTARLLMILQANPGFTGTDAVAEVGRELPQLEPQAVLQGGAQALRELLAAGVILGTRLRPVTDTTT